MMNKQIMMQVISELSREELEQYAFECTGLLVGILRSAQTGVVAVIEPENDAVFSIVKKRYEEIMISRN